VAKRRTRKKEARSAPDRNRFKPVQGKPVAKAPSVSPLLTVATVLAGLGVLLTAYLTGIRWLGQSVAYCDAGSGCDLVQASRWSTLLGMPLSFWGLLMYLLLASLLWHLRHRPAAWARALTVAAFGTGMSIYLTAVSVLEIEATCAYCLASFAIISTIFVLLVFLRPRHLQRFEWGTWGIGAGAGVALVLVVLHLHYSGMFDPAAGPEKPELRALAEHLAVSDAKFYGAYWCPHCQEQKALFEASADRLPYVECTPAGRSGPLAVECVTNRIESYPTWIIAGRRHEGLLTMESLASLSGFESPAPAPTP
jgi:uncharacterized membrane protein